MENNGRLTNLDYLNMISDGDATFKRELIDTFINNTPKVLKEMEEGLEKRSYQNIGNLAHSMKPSFTLFGMENQREIVMKLEEYGRKGVNTDEIPDLIHNLRKLMEQAIKELKTETG